MSNDFYNHNDGVPATLTRGASTTIRSEFDQVQAGFDKLPTLVQTFGGSANYVVAGGSADAWTASVAPTVLSSYADGLELRVMFPAGNATTAPTLNLNALGPKLIVSEQGAPINPGDIVAGEIATLIYNATYGKFQMALGNSVASAQASAAAAATQAGIATAQAGLATTGAGTATTQAGIATTQAGLAATAKTAAETARDAALAAQRIYATTVAGLAATTNGQYFYIPAAGSTQSLLLYLNNAGSAVLQKSMITELGAAVFDKASAKEAVGITNIFDKSLATDNFGLPDGGGAPVGSGGLFYTGYLPVIAGDYITFSLAARINFGVQFYDADKNWLSSPGAPAAGTPVAVPATAVYARCTFQNGLSGGRVTNSKHDLVAVQGQTLPSYYMPYGRPSAYTLWRQMAIEAYEGPQRNIFISSTVTLNQTFAYNTGVLSASAGFFTSDLIPVVPGATYTVYSSVGSNPLNEGALFYDIDQNYIYGQDPAFLTGLTTITVPAGCFFLRIAGRMASNVYNFVQVYRGTAAPGSIGLITPAMKADVAGQWASKNWFVQGDSITDVGVGGFGGWFESAAAFHGAVVSQNAALGGRAMVDALKKHDGTSLVSGDFTNIDLAVLFLGTNDYRTGTTIGSITDSTATASFYGRAKNFVETVLGWKPLIRLVIATPMRMTIDSPSNDPINYVTALRAIAAKYALPVLDFYALSGFNDITMATLTSDGLHPNAAGRVAGVTNPAIGFFKTCLPVT